MTDFAVVVATLAMLALVVGRTPTGWQATFSVIAVATMAARGAYARRLEDSLVVVLVQHVLASAAIATTSTVTIRVLVSEQTSSSRELVATFLAVTLALAVARIATSMIDDRRRRAGVNTLRAVVVGSGEVALRAAGRLQTRSELGLRPIGFLDDSVGRGRAMVLSDGGGALPVLGGSSDLDAVIDRHRIDALIVTQLEGSDTDTRASALVARAHERRMTVFVLPRIHEAVNSRTRRHRLGTFSIDELRPVDPRSRAFRAKYAIDRIVGSVALIVLLPVLLTIALLVSLSSSGPVLFRQRRVGLDGREFDILKFRSMRLPSPSSGPVAAPAWTPKDGQAPGGIEGEDRRTLIGRFLRTSNLDELPQLINIAKGEMCIVGPRPERPEFVQRFSQELRVYDARHRVKAGLTGWSQVHGFRGQTSIAERAEWDNYYIENWSFALDIAIIVRTFKTFFRGGE